MKCINYTSINFGYSILNKTKRDFKLYFYNLKPQYTFIAFGNQATLDKFIFLYIFNVNLIYQNRFFRFAQSHFVR